MLTHYGIVGQHWLRYWLVAWRHQAITWTNVDSSSMKSSDIHIRAISQEMPQPSIPKIHLKITYSKFHSNFPGANELIMVVWWFIKACLHGTYWRWTHVSCTTPHHLLLMSSDMSLGNSWTDRLTASGTDWQVDTNQGHLGSPLAQWDTGAETGNCLWV